MSRIQIEGKRLRREISPLKLRMQLMAMIMTISMITVIWPGGDAQAAFCTLGQITNTVGTANSRASINADGTRIVLESNANLTGSNPDGNFEIFLFDTVANALSQVTNSTAGSSFSPSINADGTRIAFHSFANLTGGNPDGNFEIFLFDTAANTLSQVTNSTAGGSALASINADGTRIAFDSFANLTGGNADGNTEIFLFDTVANALSQVTNSTAGSSFSPSINADGTRIAFHSFANLTGGNPDGNFEIFLFDTAANTLSQVTNSTAGSFGSPSINANGARIAFASSANLTGGNADGNFEIFLFDTATNGLSQITNSVAGNSARASINADGTHIAFDSSANLTGSNADGSREIFLFDTANNSFTQVTNSTAGDSGFPSISADGARIAFESFANLIGGNPDGNPEIFLAGCELPPAPPADLAISKAADSNPVKTKSDLIYTIAVFNAGPNKARGVVMNDPLPAGTTFVAAFTTHGSLITPIVGGAGTLTNSIGDLEVGETAVITLVVRVEARGKEVLVNIASVEGQGQDPNPANNTARLETRVFGSKK